MLKEILLLMVLIAFNGIFAASEMAFLSVDKFALKEKVKKHNKKAMQLDRLIKNPSTFLATIQIGITLAGFLASAFAAETFADYLVTKIVIAGVSIGTIKGIVMVIVTVILSYFTLVFGELVPKRFALAYPDKIAYATTSFITVLMKITYPFVWILTKSTDMVAYLFRIKKVQEEKLTEEEIKKIILTGKEEGAIESAEGDMIFQIFAFNDTIVKDAMTKKENMVMIEVDTPHKELLRVIKESKYTRMPVYEKEKDHIIGILNVKSLLLSYSKTATLSLRKILYTPKFVTEDEMIDDVFRQMQKEHCYISIVKNRDENVIGMITMEDAVEEIVGNIYDEYDEENEI